MKEIKLTQGYVTFVDDEDYEYLNQWKWHVIKDSNTFYARRNIRQEGLSQGAIYIHRVIINTPVGLFTDHIDHNGLNNQKNNLRICTKSENNRNKSKNLHYNSSRYKGVNYYKRDLRWYAHIYINGKSNHLGSFKSEIDAAKAYNKAAWVHYGEFAELNTFIL